MASEKSNHGLKSEEFDWISKCNRSVLSVIQNDTKGIFEFLITSIITGLVIIVGLVASTTITGYNQDNLDRPVDKLNCKCDCWDGFYRGVHAKHHRQTHYKAFYFNYDKQMIYILIVFIVYAQLLRKCLEKMLKLVWNEIKFLHLRRTKSINSKSILRWPILINLIISVYTNYYGTWSIINYINDRDYRMIKSQIFFSLTELIPTLTYYKVMNRFDEKMGFYKPITFSLSYPILFISLVHIYLALGEKLLWGFFYSTDKEANRNKLRDLNLIGTDVAGILFFIYSTKRALKCSRKYHLNLNQRGHLFYLKYWSLISLFLLIFYKMFCKFK
jgi:hypothetical protein